MPNYDQDVVFAPTENLDESGHTFQQSQTVDHPWDQISTSTETPKTPVKTHDAVVQSPSDALAVHQRATKRILFSSIGILGTLTSGPVKLVDSQVGRRYVVIKCPPGNTKGAYIGHEVDAVISGFAWLVSPADPPLVLETEAAIWVMAQTGAVVADVIQAAVGYDPV